MKAEIKSIRLLVLEYAFAGEEDQRALNATTFHSPTRSAALLSLLLAALAIAGCERPFVEAERPRIEVVEPDLTTIFPNTKLDLQVRLRAERTVERVEVNGDSLGFDPQERLWVIDYALHPGLNRLIFAVTDADNNTTLDTVYAMHGSLNVDRNLPNLPEPRGGHTATLSDAGTVYIIGGTSSTSSDARASAAAWSAGQFQFRGITGEMAVPRTGHTATLLPDRQILILGGSREEPLDDILDLVETAEVFDPVSETFRTIPTRGQPIRRAYHTATLHRQGDDVFVDLYGGRGDIQYGSNPTLGTRRDLRRFIFRNDSLIAVSPAPGPALDFALWGHTQTELRAFNPSVDKHFLVAGTNYTGGGDEDVSFVMDYTSQTGIAQRTTGTLVHPRTRHASVLLTDGFVGTFGGFRAEPSVPLNDVEIYSEEAGQFFAFPPSNILLRRFGLTATKLPDGRILLVGGYFSAGQGVATTSVVRIPSL